MAINRTTIAKLLSSQSRTRHPARSNRQSSRSQSAKTPSNQQQKRERRERSGSSSRQSQLAQIALYTRIAAAAITIIVLGTIAGVQYAERDQIRSGVHAFGVDLGGMTEDEARAALEEATAERRNQPLRLTDGSRRWELSA
jgi:DNA-nicking Smr family endonuclease